MMILSHRSETLVSTTVDSPYQLQLASAVNYSYLPLLTTVDIKASTTVDTIYNIPIINYNTLE
jgi:hypothetical protein